MKHARAILGLTLSWLAVACGAAPPAPAEVGATAAVDGRRVVAYVTQWGIYSANYLMSQVPAEKITHLNYAFSNIIGGRCASGDTFADFDHTKEGGTWNPGDLRGNVLGLKKLKDRNPNLKILISVGGWTWSKDFSALAATDAGRKALVSSCIDLWVKGNFTSDQKGPGIFDGIDVDWEYPGGGGLPGNTSSPADKQNYTLLMQEFRNQLNALSSSTGKQYVLSIATGAAPIQIADKQESKRLSDILDYINLMSYDYHGSFESTTNFHSGLLRVDGDPQASTGFYSDASVSKLLEVGVPPSKISLGMGFYGRGWGNVGDVNNGLFQPGSPVNGDRDDGTSGPTGVFTYKSVKQKEGEGYRKLRHPQSKQAYIYSPSTKTWIAYDDPQSMADKIAYAKSKGLGGVMIWELSQDNGELMNAIVSNIGGPNPPQPPPPPPSPMLQVGSTYSLRVVTPGFTNRSLRHFNSLGFTEVVDANSDPTLKADASWKVVAGLADANCISLQSVNFPVQYLRHAGSRARIDASTSPDPFKQDATWCVKAALDGSAGNVSLASKNFPTSYLRHRNGEVWLDPNDNSSGFKQDASWAAAPAWSTGNVTPPPPTGDSTAPTVSLSSSSTSLTNPGTITLSAQASDNVGVSRVEFYDGSTKLGEDPSAPYQQSVSLSSAQNGPHGYTAKAFDAAGNSATSSVVTVTVSIGDPVGVRAWAANVSYKVGDRVSYNAQVYSCRQAHTSIVSWEPPNVPALWLLEGNAPPPPPEPTPPPPPGPTPPPPGPTPPPPPPPSGGLAKHALVGYWHNFSNPSGPTYPISQVSSDWDVIVVAFGDNAGNGNVSFTLDGGAGGEAKFIADVAAKRAQGKKVVLSLGGQNGSITVNNQADADNFANSLAAIIKKYGFDGIDLDLESGSGVSQGAPIQTFLPIGVKALKAKLGGTMYLSMAPEWPYVEGAYTTFGGIWGAYIPIIDALRNELTLLHPQYYNNGSVFTPYTTGGLTAGSTDQLVATARMLIEGFSYSSGSKTFAGLRPDQVGFGVPSGPSSAGSGFTSPTNVNNALDCLTTLVNCGSIRPNQAYPTFRGVMTWSINWDNHDGFNFSRPVGSKLHSLP